MGKSDDAEEAVPQQIPSASEDERIRFVLETLRRAVAHACPGELASLREDLVQAALVRFLARPPEAEEVRTASYLWRVAYSVTIDELRRLRRRPVSVATPDLEQAARSDLAAELNDCFEHLAETRRLAVGLHLQGFSAKEAARALGWDEKRVRNLIFRGMVDLRNCLDGKEKP